VKGYAFSPLSRSVLFTELPLSRSV